MFSIKVPAKTFDPAGQHTGPGPWLDLIREAGALHPGLFDAPSSVEAWWAGGSVEVYEHARVIHHPDDSVSVVALDEVADHVLAAAYARLATRTITEQPATPVGETDTAIGEPAAATFTSQDVTMALNRATQDILDAVKAGDDVLHDALNLLVNATVAYPTGDASNLNEVVEHSYDTDLATVLGWIEPAL